MKRLAIVCAVSLAVAAYSRLGAAQCKIDTECKGDRVCENGQCVTPAAAAPAPAAAGAPIAPYRAARPRSLPIEAFKKGYLEFDVMIGIGSWGQKRIKSDRSSIQDQIDAAGLDSRTAGTGPFGGIYVAPRIALSESFHLGVYFRVGQGVNVGVSIEDPSGPVDGVTYHYGDHDLEDISHLHLGVGGSMKFGGMIGKRAWVGCGVDLGYHFTKIETGEAFIVMTDDPESYHGFELYPRLVVDVYLFNINGFKMSIPISLGAAIIPFSKWKAENTDVEHGWEDNDAYVWAWQIEPVLMFGFALGA
jgi:hypothetical protein